MVPDTLILKNKYRGRHENINCHSHAWDLVANFTSGK